MNQAEGMHILPSAIVPQTDSVWSHNFVPQIFLGFQPSHLHIPRELSGMQQANTGSIQQMQLCHQQHDLGITSSPLIRLHQREDPKIRGDTISARCADLVTDFIKDRKPLKSGSKVNCEELSRPQPLRDLEPRKAHITDDPAFFLDSTDKAPAQVHHGTTVEQEQEHIMVPLPLSLCESNDPFEPTPLLD